MNRSKKTSPFVHASIQLQRMSIQKQTGTQIVIISFLYLFSLFCLFSHFFLSSNSFWKEYSSLGLTFLLILIIAVVATRIISLFLDDASIHFPTVMNGVLVHDSDDFWTHSSVESLKKKGPVMVLPSFFAAQSAGWLSPQQWLAKHPSLSLPVPDAFVRADSHYYATFYKAS